MQKFAILIHAYRLIMASLLLFCRPLGSRWECYLPVPRLYKEHAHKLEYKCLICYSFEF